MIKECTVHSRRTYRKGVNGNMRRNYGYVGTKELNCLEHCSSSHNFGKTARVTHRFFNSLTWSTCLFHALRVVLVEKGNQKRVRKRMSFEAKGSNNGPNNNVTTHQLFVLFRAFLREHSHGPRSNLCSQRRLQ